MQRALPVTVVVCFIAVTAVHLAGQSAPLRQSAYLKASNPGMSDHFAEGGALPGHTGMGVAISGDGNTIAVGAPHESSSARGINGNEGDDSAYNAGAVYVYSRSGGQWTRQAYVKASNTGAGDYFGSFVSLSADGNTMAVAAHWESSAATGVNGNQGDDSQPQAGAVYVFTRSGSTWTQQAYLKASNTGRAGSSAEEPGDGDQFGFSLALSRDGNTLAVGANSEDSNAAGAKSDPRDDSFNLGRRRLRVRAKRNHLDPAGLSQGRRVDQYRARRSVRFSVALNANGNTLAVGVYDESGSGRAVNAPIDRMRGGSGAVYVFVRSGATWTREAHQDMERRRRRPGRLRRAQRRRQYAGDRIARRRLCVHGRRERAVRRRCDRSEGRPVHRGRGDLRLAAAPRGASRPTSKPRTPARRTGSACASP